MNDKILEIIERETDYRAEMATQLDALGADSLEFMNLLLEIENETGKSVPAEKIGGLNTVADLVEALC